MEVSLFSLSLSLSTRLIHLPPTVNFHLYPSIERVHRVLFVYYSWILLMEYVKSARMPKWVWNPFEGDVTLPYMYVCVCVLTFEEKKEEIVFFLAGS